jgi:hypothetical protein
MTEPGPIDDYISEYCPVCVRIGYRVLHNIQGNQDSTPNTSSPNIPCLPEIQFLFSSFARGSEEQGLFG